ncbi:hypothetical protein M422DRAFT_249257 [Sphaerobolus stellatus SS14]|uniref:Unplaced genomic scaffold SPHSTscaffold_29, whole genome shotgun sequence n=1 Tax=Sphaerobolus stellatus (strain SS14) TaxID=990650 RepID=A0A0C9W5C6_SPHS4|nr:hypothetical protein M422DRAFT_249257 [Sphaerobolus stellatus SS14]
MKLSVAFAFLAVNALTVLATALPAAEPELKWISVEDLSTTSQLPSDIVFTSLLYHLHVFDSDNETSLTKRLGAEVVSCYNFGTRADRAPSTSAIDDFCSHVNGRQVNNGQSVSMCYNYGAFTILVSGAAINGCNFMVDGNCNRLLRKPLDECNTSGENGKQFSTLTSYESICNTQYIISTPGWDCDRPLRPMALRPGSNGSDV